MTTSADILARYSEAEDADPSVLTVEELQFLEHYGVPGMKWGKRKARPGPSKDSKRATQIRKKGQQGTPKALTNKEIEEFTRRVNLEQKYAKLTPSKRKVTTNQVIALAASVNAAIAFSQTPFGKEIGKRIKKQMEWK